VKGGAARALGARSGAHRLCGRPECVALTALEEFDAPSLDIPQPEFTGGGQGLAKELPGPLVIARQSAGEP
jgi:hypothetical protein